MAILRAAVVGVTSTFLAWVLLAASGPSASDPLAAPGARAAGLNGNSYTVLEGPHAGTTIKVGNNPNNAEGFASKEDNKASEVRGFIRNPNPNCPFLHFEGRIGGKKIKETDCLRVVASGYAQPFLTEMAQAILKEEKEKPNAAVKELNDALEQLEKAKAAGKLDQKTFDEMEFGIKRANKLDENAAKDFKKGGGYEDDAEKDLKKAINLKQEVVSIAPLPLKVAQPPVLQPISAVFQPAAFQTVYTEVAANPDGRTLTYTWTLVELNDPPCVNFEPNKPLDNQAIWHHPDSQCNHALEGPNGHQGVIGLLVTDGKFSCPAVFLGSNTNVGPAPPPCQPAAVGF